MEIPFNDPYISEKSKEYILHALSEKYSCPGVYCSKVNKLLGDHFSAESRITTSCTAALEVAKLQLTRSGDEVISHLTHLLNICGTERCNTSIRRY